MKKTKDVSDEDEYSADDPDEVEEEVPSEEEWTPETGGEGGTKRPQRQVVAKKRHHSEEEDEEDEEEGESDEDIDDEESDSDSGKKPKRKRRSKKDDDDKDDDDDDDSDTSFNEASGEPPKDYTSGAFVVAKNDVSGSNKDPTTLWRIDGKALLQKFLPFKEDGKTLYKSTSTYSGWSINNKDNYYVAHVTFKVQSRAETIVELTLLQSQEDVKNEKED